MNTMARYMISTVVGLVVAITLLWWNPLGFSNNMLLQSVAWDGCSVAVVVDTEGMPAGGLEQAQRAVAHVAAASGLAMPVTVGNPGDGGDGRLVISWSENPAGEGVVAYGHTESVVRMGSIRRSHISVLSSARMANNTMLERYTIEHELGHALGLSHTSDPASFMFMSADESSIHPLTSADKSVLRAAGDAACRPANG